MPMACPGPSLSSAFDILHAAGQDKLLYLKHKLKTLHPGCRAADLLHAMVLLMLGQETEARISLEALKADAVARLVARQWAGMDSSANVPEETPDVSWAIARVYHLLAEEKLCPAAVRDEAYRAALQAFSLREDPQLRELQEEARAWCGWDIVGDPGVFQPLHSDLDCLPLSSGTRSLPQPIENPLGWSRGCSLRSTGSPASLASNLEISHSPTVAPLSSHRIPHGPSKLCDESLVSPVPEPVPMGCQEPEEMSWPPSGEIADTPVPPNSPGPRVPEVALDASPAGLPDSSEAPDTSTHYPVECTEVSPAPKSLPSPSRNPCPVKDQMPLQPPIEDTTCSTAQPSPPTPSAPKTSSPNPSPSTPLAHPASSSPCPPSPELDSSEQKFYNFVVLHSREDEHIALRVRDKLESLGVPDGATFCEDFQVPGRGELCCLQDAIDHSAFTILLLTANFDRRLSLHQVNQSLMNSLTQPGRQDCVIPFLPLESSQAQVSPYTSSLLRSLVWLDEHSLIFARKVANTFKPQKLRACKTNWRKDQDTRALREQRQYLEGERQQAAAWNAAYSAYLQSYLSWQEQMENLQAAFRSHVTLGTQVPYGGQGPLGTQLPFPTWPGHQPPSLPPWLAGSHPSAFPQPPAFPTTPQSAATSQSPGLQPLIIHHAQMVQLGLNNHMWSQRGTQEPEDKTQEAE